MTDPKWKFDPTINLGHVLTFVGFLITGFIGWTSLDKRVVALEEAQKTQHQIDRAQDQLLNQQMQHIRETLNELRAGVQRVNDRLYRNENHRP
ncbi:MAG: hypothetical protein RLZ03_1884 [Pseudomonadota bacterium]|jgi:ATP-dependent Zn protease